MTKPLTPGERVQNNLERYRGPQKPPRPQNIAKPMAPKPTPRKSFKSPRGK